MYKVTKVKGVHGIMTLKHQREKSTNIHREINTNSSSGKQKKNIKTFIKSQIVTLTVVEKKF